ncbi:MAG TPA: hypothetical protein VI541_05775 [Actinomycetota bacterium]|nr:hypothetical protein [Actinomycetota bacterium]
MALILASFAAALGWVLLDSRRVVGSVPGDAPILGLAAVKSGFAVATEKGVYFSSDGETWSKVAKFGSKPSLATSGADDAFIWSDRILAKTSDLATFDVGAGSLLPAVAISVDSAGNIYVAEDPRHYALVGPDGGLQRITAGPGPQDVIAIAGIPGEPVTLLVGGLNSGLWRSTDGGLHWRQILLTPTRALLIDPSNAKKVLLGTAGGVLYSRDGGLRWFFSDLRSSVEALSASGGRFYALTQDRLLYSSEDGIQGWARFPN